MFMDNEPGCHFIPLLTISHDLKMCIVRVWNHQTDNICGYYRFLCGSLCFLCRLQFNPFRTHISCCLADEHEREWQACQVINDEFLRYQWWLPKDRIECERAIVYRTKTHTLASYYIIYIYGIRYYCLPFHLITFLFKIGYLHYQATVCFPNLYSRISSDCVPHCPGNLSIVAAYFIWNMSFECILFNVSRNTNLSKATHIHKHIR